MTQDIRQSSNWAKYLETLGWQVYKTKSGVQIATLKKAFISYAKIQRPKNLDTNDIYEIENLCQKKKCNIIKIEPNLDQDLTVLKHASYTPNKSPLLVPSTLVLDLTKSEDELWNELSKSAKYSINRAKREEFTTSIYVNPNRRQVLEFVEILKESAAFNGTRNFSLEEMSRKIRIFGPDAIVSISRTKEGAACGGCLYLGWKNKAWYTQGGTTALGRENKGGYLLYWNSILQLKNLGYTQLDLEGIVDKRFGYTKSWRGFSDFKQKFGGIKITYPRPYIKSLHSFFNTLLKITHLPL